MTKLTWSSPKLTTRTLTFGALLIAIQLCLSKLSVGPENVVKVGLGFIGTAMAWWSCIGFERPDQQNRFFNRIVILYRIYLLCICHGRYRWIIFAPSGNYLAASGNVHFFPDPDFKRVLQHDVDLFDVLPDQNGRCLVWPFGSATSKGNHHFAVPHERNRTLANQIFEQ